MLARAMFLVVSLVFHWINCHATVNCRLSVQRFTTSSSAIADKPARRAASRQTAKFWNNHVTIATQLLYMSSFARIDIAYLCTKLDDFRFIRSSAMIGALKFLMGHITWPRLYQGRFVVRRLRLAHLTPTSNLESLRSPITKMNKATQNV